jgi:hypothetical protein
MFNLKFILLASFGPYILKEIGLRLEHFIIYISFLYFFAFNYKICSKSFNVFMLLVTCSFLPLIGEFAVIDNHNISQILSGLDNYLLFATTFYISSVFFNYNKNYEVNEIMLYYCYLICFNSVIALVSISGFISEFLNFFHSTTIENIELGVNSVSTLSSQMNRFTGILDQPLEAGFAYSIALFSLIYIYSSNFITLNKFLILSLIISIGGIITISKVFVLCGLFLSFSYFFTIININLRNIMSVLFIWLLFGFFFELTLFYSGGTDFYNRLFDFSNLYSNIIEGRYQENSSINNELINIYNNYLFFGAGFTGRSIYDSGYFQYLIQGGLITLISHLCILFYVNYQAYFISKNIFKLISFINILQLITLMGGPTILSNRVPIYLAILFSLIIHLRRYHN